MTHGPLSLRNRPLRSRRTRSSMMVHCHCSMCRKHHGSAYVTWVAAPLAASATRQARARSRATPRPTGIHRSSARPAARSRRKWTSSRRPGRSSRPATSQGTARHDPGISHVRRVEGALVHDHGRAAAACRGYPPEFGMQAVERAASVPPASVVHGSCLCGSVAYEIAGPPLAHVSTATVRAAGSRAERAFATNAFFRRRRLPVEARRGTRDRSTRCPARSSSASLSAAAVAATCRACRANAMSVSVPAGSLDSDPGIAPGAHLRGLEGRLGPDHRTTASAVRGNAAASLTD